MANGTCFHISHISHSMIPGLNNRSLALRNILHVPKIIKHLLSTQKLVNDNDALNEIHSSVFFVKDKG